MSDTYPSAALQEIVEYRGVEGLVAAEVLCDDNSTDEGHGYVTGDVFAIAGVAEISRTTDSSNEAHYYDNIPAVVVANTAADEVTISASAIPFDVLATITGQTYDQTTGTLIEGTRELKYFALGYKTQKTNGDEVYVWRLKGTFNVPDTTNATQNDGTDANGQELTFTGISTTHKFTSLATTQNPNGKGAKALNVDVAKGLADVTDFFDEVVTPDTLQAATPASVTYYNVSYNANGGTGSIDSVAVEEGSSIGLNDGSTLTPPSNKVFAGWAKTSSASSPTVTSPFTPTADTTLYAVWTDEA